MVSPKDLPSRPDIFPFQSLETELRHKHTQRRKENFGVLAPLREILYC
ncbi:MAG: hypothetical protein SAK29_22600 [Scytonema sp. PMC 1069.18]|nr:hypothetical protein [Scytonema sp. PMC 1069.18]MEC4882204.1 hypothetical protein [Scytonema sp. PMC 1070.18]